ncbi:hypothetical protein D9M73_147020 [compost metagenome]
MVVELEVVFRVPAVVTDQYAQPSGGGINDIERVLAVRLDPVLLCEERVYLALGLADRHALAVEHHAAVVQRAATDFQGAVDDARFGQHDGAGDQRHVEFPGQSSEQRLVVSGHRLGFHAQVGIVQAVATLGADQRSGELEGIAHRQPVHGLLEGAGLIQLIFFAADHQPGTDVFRQHDDGLAVQQTLVPGCLQIGRELAVQTLGALIIGRKQFGLNAQQIATIGRRALVDSQVDPQVRKVVTHRPVRGPHRVGREGGEQRHGECQVQKFAHGDTVYSLEPGVAFHLEPD